MDYVLRKQAMAEISATNTTTDTLTLWKPRFVLLIGIAGGIPQDDLDLGDVVVADQVVGYDYGKATDHGVKPCDRVYPASAMLVRRDESRSPALAVPAAMYESFLSVPSPPVTKSSLRPSFGSNSQPVGPNQLLWRWRQKECMQPFLSGLRFRGSGRPWHL
jgi:hypothetical protein